MTLLTTLLPAFLFVGALAFVSFLKVRQAIAMMRWLVDGTSSSMRRVGVLSLVPGAVSMLWLCAQGLHPPTALIVGMSLALGVFVAALGVLGMERVLFEPESEMIARQEAQLPPATSPASRAVAVALGVAMIIGVGLVMRSIAAG